jgi:hypothetical protein
LKPAGLTRWLGFRGFSLRRTQETLAALGVALAADTIRREPALGRAGCGRLPRPSPDEVRVLRRLRRQTGGSER